MIPLDYLCILQDRSIWGGKFGGRGGGQRTCRYFPPAIPRLPPFHPHHVSETHQINRNTKALIVQNSGEDIDVPEN